MFGRLWVRFKNWVTRVRHFFFGAPPEQQPLLQPIAEAYLSQPVPPEQVPAFASAPLRRVLRSPQPNALINQAQPVLAQVPQAELPINKNKCKFSRTQKLELCKLRKYPGSIFARVPRDVIQYISRLTDAEYDPASDIAKLLHEIAYGNPAAVIAMLTRNPRLLLEAGDVLDPAGNTIICVTPYECALGAGDDDMAATIAGYFTKIEDGEKERVRQYARYQPDITRLDEMMKAYDIDSDEPTQGSDFDFQSLLGIFIKSPAADVTAALTLNFDHESELANALEAMRSHFSPHVIKGGMHFNYANLLEAFKVYAREFDKLNSSGNNYDKCDLFWRQVIGYIQRGLPACDRQAFAQGLYQITHEKKPLNRSFGFTYGGGDFPITQGDESRSGLGYEFGARANWDERGGSAVDARDGRGGFSKLMSNKSFKLAKPMQPPREKHSPGCVIC